MAAGHRAARRSALDDFRQFKKLLARAGLPSVRVHDPRHTAASLLLAQNVSREAADSMGRTLWQDEGDQDHDDHDDPVQGNRRDDAE